MEVFSLRFGAVRTLVESASWSMFCFLWLVVMVSVCEVRPLPGRQVVGVTPAQFAGHKFDVTSIQCISFSLQSPLWMQHL